MTTPAPIERIQQNVLAVQERRLLNWICPRLPGWVTPDQLTLLALIGAVLIFVGYAASHLNPNWLWLSVFGFWIHWFGDSLDGSVARFRSIERPRYGYFIDHSADGLGNLMIVGGLGLSPFVRLDVSLLALAGYYLLSIHAFLAVRVLGELRLSYAAAGPTGRHGGLLLHGAAEDHAVDVAQLGQFGQQVGQLRPVLHGQHVEAVVDVGVDVEIGSVGEPVGHGTDGVLLKPLPQIDRHRGRLA